MVKVSLIDKYRTPNSDKIWKWLSYPYRIFKILRKITWVYRFFNNLDNHMVYAPVVYAPSVGIFSFTTLYKAQPAACIYQLICRSKLWLDWIPLTARIFKIPQELILHHSPECFVLKEFGGVGFSRHVTDITCSLSWYDLF